MGLEGIVSKRLGSTYRSGRSPDWLKFKNPEAPAVKREAEEEWDMLMLAFSSSSPRHRGRIERGVDGGDHRVIGGLATEMCGDRPQEMIALSHR
jgi:ATP-dependent DNA ligase